MAGAGDGAGNWIKILQINAIIVSRRLRVYDIGEAVAEFVILVLIRQAEAPGRDNAADDKARRVRSQRRRWRPAGTGAGIRRFFSEISSVHDILAICWAGTPPVERHERRIASSTRSSFLVLLMVFWLRSPASCPGSNDTKISAATVSKILTMISEKPACGWQAARFETIGFAEMLGMLQSYIQHLNVWLTLQGMIGSLRRRTQIRPCAEGDDIVEVIGGIR